MESRPPQEPPPRRPSAPNNGRKGGPPASAPPPPWIWVLAVAALAAILIFLKPAQETSVPYSWFHEQVLDDNVKTLQISGLVATGSLRARTKFTPAEGTTPISVEKFSTAFPSDHQIQPVLDVLESYKKEGSRRHRVQIDATPSQASS